MPNMPRGGTAFEAGTAAGHCVSQLHPDLVVVPSKGHRHLEPPLRPPIEAPIRCVRGSTCVSTLGCGLLTRQAWVTPAQELNVEQSRDANPGNQSRRDPWLRPVVQGGRRTIPRRTHPASPAGVCLGPPDTQRWMQTCRRPTIPDGEGGVSRETRVPTRRA